MPTTPDTDRIAADLLAMTAPAGEAGAESRSLENPNVPITAAQLADVLSLGPTRAGVSVNEHTALTFTAVFTAIKVLSESVGMLPLVVYAGDEDDTERARAKTHPVYWLLRHQPNPEMTATVFKETLQAHLAGWGNAYARIEFDRGGDPAALWPLMPDRTFPERVGGKLMYRVTGPDGGRFFPEEILHIPGLGFNGIKGYSPIAMAKEAIAMGKAAEIFGATFYGNGSHMGAVVTHKNKMKPEAKANIREGIETMHRGAANGHKILVLDEDWQYEKIGIPPDEAQFIETRKFSILEIARIFRIPPHMLGDLDRATFSNIEELGLQFLTYTLSPWLDKWEQECNRKLFRRGEGHFCQFDERRLMRGDLAARKDYYATARQWGWMSANDVLREEGMNPIGDQGDVYLSPMNMVPPSQIGKTDPKAVPAPKAGPDSGGMGGASRMADAFRSVFIDAVGRMLRKEANAVTRANGKPDKVEQFYTSHRSHVFDSLLPGAVAMGAALGIGEDEARTAVTPILWTIARQRNATTETDVSAMAESIAPIVIEKVTEALATGRPTLKGF